MSRKLWAPLGVLALVASCLGFGLVSSAANASGTYTWTVSVTGCDNGTHDGKFSSTYTNSDTQSHFVTYSYDINGNGGGSGAYGPIVNPGQSVTVYASGVKAATYDWTLFIDNGLVASKQVTMPPCPVTIHRQCLQNGNWRASWNVTNLKDQPGTLAGTNTRLDGSYAAAGGTGSEKVYSNDASVRNATLAFPGNQPETMTWADDTTEQFTFPAIQRPAGCTPVVTKVRPHAVTFRDKHGMKHDVYVIPTTKGVAYTVHGKVVKAGRHHARGTVTVKAVAKHGYTLIGKTVWSHRFSRH